MRSSGFKQASLFRHAGAAGGRTPQTSSLASVMEVFTISDLSGLKPVFATGQKATKLVFQNQQTLNPQAPKPSEPRALTPEP